jgi:hypothetical protein
MKTKLLFLVAVAAVPGMLSACEVSRTCSGIGCSTQAAALILLPGEPTPESRVIACHNNECVEGIVTGGGGDEPVKVTFTDPPKIEASFRFDLSPPRLQVTWILADAGATNGDRFSVMVVDAAGAPTTTFEASATFQVVTPNGSDCPPVCRQAVLTST